LAIVDAADAVRAVCEINSVHAIDADQKNVLDSVLTEVVMIVVVVLRNRGGCRTLAARESMPTIFFIITSGNHN
jgi:hypothetical protein